MERKLRLNLGCGSVYRPGYVNIDLFDRRVADSFSDVEDLPFEPNSVDEIEASQLIEHFDLVHCRYLLAGWFRVLRPGGTLALETPDLASTFRKFVSAKEKDKEATLQWVYGIDSPGLQHKGGFTFELLQALLLETGFVDIKREPAVTHTYEPGMRVACTKSYVCDEAQFMSGLRRRVRQSLSLSDSYTMIPLEDWMRRIRAELGAPSSLNEQKLRKIVSMSASCNPAIALCVLEECVDMGLFKRGELAVELEVLAHLSEMRFHERAFALWVKSSKTPKFKEEFGRFLSRLERTVMETIDRPKDRDNILDYLHYLEPRPIALLDILLVEQESKERLNVGIRMFSESRMDEAVEALLDSVSLNPANPLAYWNLARIGIATGRGREQILDEYERAASLLSSRKLQARITSEADLFRTNHIVESDLKPICEADLV